MFKRSTVLTPEKTVQHLFQCCDEDLGDAILKGHPAAVTSTEAALLTTIKELAVIPVAICVRRAELLTTKQGHGENARAFYAKVKGKVATCSYSITCSSSTCAQVIDFTDVIVKDVIVAGLVDDEIKKEVLGLADLDNKSLIETVTFIEAKEMALDVLHRQPIAAAVSFYKSKGKPCTKPVPRISCKACKSEIGKFVWNKRQGRMIECSLCLPCWKKASPRRGKTPKDEHPGDETSALLIGGITSVTPISAIELSGTSLRGKSVHDGASTKKIILDHHIFHSGDGWRKSESLSRPTLRLCVTTDVQDYDHIGASCLRVMPSFVTVVTDTGAQSCLQDFYRCGFKESDILPIRRTMRAGQYGRDQHHGCHLRQTFRFRCLREHTHCSDHGLCQSEYAEILCIKRSPNPTRRYPERFPEDRCCYGSVHCRWPDCPLRMSRQVASS